jgi:phage terminase small subunit
MIPTSKPSITIAKTAVSTLRKVASDVGVDAVLAVADALPDGAADPDT